MEQKSITLLKAYEDAFKIFLKTNKIRYEPPEDGDSIYYSIEIATEMIPVVDAFLDGLYRIRNDGFAYGYTLGKEDAEALARMNARVER